MPEFYEDEDEDDDAECQDDDYWVKRSKMNQFKVSPTLRRTMEPFMAEQLEDVEDFFVDATHPNHGQLKKHKVTSNAGVYAIFDSDGKLVKIGSTKNMKARRAKYVEQGICMEKDFVCILDFT